MRGKAKSRLSPARVERERKYLAWLVATRDWSLREAQAYVAGGPVALAKLRGQIERERKATTLAEQMAAAEDRRADPVGVSRLFVNCERHQCTLPRGHSGQHQLPRRSVFVTPADLEEGEPWGN